jgi:hypothetical protein
MPVDRVNGAELYWERRGSGPPLREGIDQLIHPSVTSSFAVAYIVLAISTVLDLMSIRQSAGQMAPWSRLPRWP